MSEQWMQTQLGKVCEIILGQSPSSETYNQERIGLPFFQGKSKFGSKYAQAKTWCSDPLKVAKKEDILISVRAPVGESNLAPENCCIGRGLAALRADQENLLQEFLWHQINFKKGYLQGISQGSTFDAISGKDLSELEVEIPPLPEQKKIAEILSRIEKAIDRASTLLQKEKFALHAVLNEQIEAIDDRYRKTAGDMLKENFLTALKDGNHGEQYPKKSEFTQTGVPYLSASAISEDGDIDLTSCPCLPPERSCLMRIPPAEGGDVILTHNASIGKVAIIPENAGAVIPSTSTTYYRTNKEVLRREFLAATMMSDFYQNQLKRIMGQTTRNQVPITAQQELVLIAPPRDAQERISRVYNYYRTIRLGRIAQIKGLQLLRSSLSSDLLSGRKRVSV